MPRLPGIDHRRAVRAFEKAGFWVEREGKHIAMTDGQRIITRGRRRECGYGQEDGLTTIVSRDCPACVSGK